MSDWRELAYEAERDRPHNGEDFYTAIRHYFDLAALAQQLADRDAAWEEAIRLNYDQTFGLDVDGFIIVVRRWIENKEGKT